jgi:branched-chain amino acid transport system ATP-binding protein
MLEITRLEVKYGEFQVLWGVDALVQAGQIVAMLGPNGAGKSTVLNTVSGFAPRATGTITFGGERIDGLRTHEIVARGLVHVLERHRVFPYLSVQENLLLGRGCRRPSASASRRLRWCMSCSRGYGNGPGSGRTHCRAGSSRC